MLLCKKQFPIIFLLFPVILKKKIRNEINFQSNVKFQVQIIIKGNAKLQKEDSHVLPAKSSNLKFIIIFNYFLILVVCVQ